MIPRSDILQYTTLITKATVIPNHTERQTNAGHAHQANVTCIVLSLSSWDFAEVRIYAGFYIEHKEALVISGIRLMGRNLYL